MLLTPPRMKSIRSLGRGSTKSRQVLPEEWGKKEDLAQEVITEPDLEG